MENRLLSVEGSARYLGVRKSTIYSWAARKKIPSVKIGRRLLFDRKDLDDLIENGKREVESPLGHGNKNKAVRSVETVSTSKS